MQPIEMNDGEISPPNPHLHANRLTSRGKVINTLRSTCKQTKGCLTQAADQKQYVLFTPNPNA